VLKRCGIPRTGELVVELGCGSGRMTSSFARNYRRVVAIDLSSEMLQRAREIHFRERNILWLRLGGTDLACLPSDSVDFLFSYLVLQHFPSEALVFSYIRETLRVVKPGGAFLFQFNGSHKPNMNLRGRLAWGAVDLLWSAGLRAFSQKTASVLGLDHAAAGKSWRGVAIRSERIAAFVQANGGDVREMPGAGTPLAWCCGVKKPLDQPC
jgi:SAM-dependent methyltransferase